MTTIYGTENNDTIDATYSNGTSWGDSVKAGDGDDTVKLGRGVSYFSGPGNDTITAEYSGSYAGSIVVFEDPSPSGKYIVPTEKIAKKANNAAPKVE